MVHDFVLALPCGCVRAAPRAKSSKHLSATGPVFGGFFSPSLPAVGIGARCAGGGQGPGSRLHNVAQGPGQSARRARRGVAGQASSKQQATGYAAATAARAILCTRGLGMGFSRGRAPPGCASAAAPCCSCRPVRAAAGWPPRARARAGSPRPAWRSAARAAPSSPGSCRRPWPFLIPVQARATHDIVEGLCPCAGPPRLRRR